MEYSIKIISSERGGELIFFGTHKYRLRRRRKDGNLKWLCTNKNCCASISTASDKNGVCVCESLGEHIIINND